MVLGGALWTVLACGLHGGSAPPTEGHSDPSTCNDSQSGELVGVQSDKRKRKKNDDTSQARKMLVIN